MGKGRGSINLKQVHKGPIGFPSLNEMCLTSLILSLKYYAITTKKTDVIKKEWEIFAINFKVAGFFCNNKKILSF